ncbi:Pre-mRNA-splicing factor spp2 [Coemansia sp. RSA 455]|nr:Pre-mRNA-splicing factor spp2 [Coemansia sp. RSA 455]
MRRTGKAQIGSSANFKGVKKPVRGFDDPNSESTDNKTIAIVDAQSEVILGNGETKKELVIPVKRNADWMKKREPQTTVTEKFGLQVMTPTKARDKHSRIGQAPPVVEDDSDVDEETYERVPIESFGAAMLRGMGWKEETDSTTVVTNNSRPSLLGLGAKALEKK